MKNSKERVGVSGTLMRNVNSKEEFNKVQEELSSAKPILERLRKVLHSKAEKVFPKLDDYSVPNWDVMQADRNGYLRALSEIETIINLDHKETIKQCQLTKTTTPE